MELEDLATKHFERTRRKFTLDRRELETVSTFLDGMRFDSRMGIVSIANYSATNAFMLTCIVLERMALIWGSCCVTAHRSQIDPRYLYATTAANLWFQTDKQHEKPVAQNLLALVHEEKVAATRTLAAHRNAQQAPPTPPVTELSIQYANIKVENAQVDITTLEKKVSDAREQHKEHEMTVSRWSELAIGIDKDWDYWAITPAPTPGRPFRKNNAVKIHLPGKQWKALLKLFAESSDIEFVSLYDVTRNFAKLPAGITFESDGRARPD